MKSLTCQSICLYELTGSIQAPSVIAVVSDGSIDVGELATVLGSMYVTTTQKLATPCTRFNYDSRFTTDAHDKDVVVNALSEISAGQLEKDNDEVGTANWLAMMRKAAALADHAVFIPYDTTAVDKLVIEENKYKYADYYSWYKRLIQEVDGLILCRRIGSDFMLELRKWKFNRAKLNVEYVLPISVGNNYPEL